MHEHRRCLGGACAETDAKRMKDNLVGPMLLVTKKSSSTKKISLIAGSATSSGAALGVDQIV
jgi:hypothetical protein